MHASVRLTLALAGALCLAWFASVGGGCAVTQSQDVEGKTMDVTEPVTERNYYLYLPDDWNKDRPQPYPLIVSIHGMKPFDNAMPQLMSWKKICDEKDWIVIAPQLKSPDMLNQFPFRKIDSSIIDDEGQIISSVQDVIRRYNADASRVLLTGWSSGGYLIHYMGARHPEMWSAISAQGSNFSEDIMPEVPSETARQTPVYIYHGENDFPMVVKDSNKAMQWYMRQGYSSVRMDEAPGGHERHPEFGTRFFIGHLAGTNRYLANASIEQAKQRARNEPWLGEGAGGTTVASAAPSTGGTAAPPAGSANVGQPKYVWDNIGPRTPGSSDGDSQRLAAAPARPLQTAGIEQIETGRPRPVARSAEPRPSVDSDNLTNVAPSAAAPTAVPIGPAMERPGSAGPATPTPGPSEVTLARADGETRPRSPSGSPPRRISGDIRPGTLPQVSGPRTPVASTANPVAGMTPDGSTATATPVASAQPRAVPSAPNRSGVRIVTSANEGTAPFTVEFRTEVRSVNAEVVRYRWRLDDILFSTAHQAVLTFQRPGQYPIELTIYDSAGNTYRDRIILRVFAVEG